MEIREAQDGDVLVLSPDGSLASGEDCTALENRLAAVLKRGVRFLVVDCTSVGQIRAPGIRALLQASKKLGRVQGRLALCAMNPKVQRAFSISGFDRDFTVLPTREEALRRVLEPVAAPATRTRTPAPGPVDELVAASPAPAEPAPSAEPALSAAPAEAPPVPPVVAPPPPQTVSAVEAPSAVPVPLPPASDDHDALAVALLEALGERGALPTPPSRPGTAAPVNHHVLAGLLLAALAARSA